MYTVMIVDDEARTREGLVNLINWESIDISIIGQASDGLEALALFEKSVPDILICDINMPQMNGITLISNIKDKYPKMQIILLSGYSNEEYLRSAIRYGVLDYLNKPVNLVELLSVVERAKQQITNPIHAVYQNHTEEVIALLLHGTPLESSRGLPIDFSQRFLTGSLRFDETALSIDNQLIPVSEAEKMRLFFKEHQTSYTKALEAIFGNTVFLYTFDNRYVFHVNLPAVENLAHWSKLLEQVFSTHRAVSASMNIILSHLTQGVDKVRDSYQQMLGADRTFYQGYGMIFTPQENTHAPDFKGVTIQSEEIIALLGTPNFSEISITLASFFHTLSLGRVEDIPVVRALALDFVQQISQVLSRKKGMSTTATVESEKRLNTLEDIANYCSERIGKYISNHEALQGKGRVVYDVELFILKHYDSNLSIDQIAAHVGLTSTYLCYLYKKTTGHTINEFITNTKTNKAKELLKEPSLRLGEIADMLGYNSANYFTRAFKKNVGISPSDYRNSII